MRAPRASWVCAALTCLPLLGALAQGSELAAAAVSTTTIAPTADAFVTQGSPAKNYGNADFLRASGGGTIRRSYLTFAVPNVAGALSSAVLRLYATQAGSGGYAVRRVSNSWSESSITYNNAPTVGSLIRSAPAFGASTWTSVDITSAVTPGTTLRIVVTASSGNPFFGSREAAPASRPQLVLTSGAPDPSPSPTATTPPPPPTDPLIAAAGDIVCDPTDANYNNGFGTTNYCHAAATAALLDGRPYSAILTLGDNQYEDGTLAKFQSAFAPAWGRFRPLLRPVPGNHEYIDTNAAGYYSYFGAPAGDPAKGYYSYDIGAWHVVALNGECDFVGGCGAGSAQETWLKADLAAHPATCTLAYWHEPRFSSGVYSTGAPGFTSFWQALDAAGVDVVLNGHIHNYERFEPQDVNGTARTSGIREFVVGTGGKSLVGFASTPRANSAVRDAATYGVLEMSLHASSYDWSFRPEAGKTFTDLGTSACH